MARKYQHTLELLPQIKEMLESGMSQKEVENKLGITPSMSRRGNPYDNTLAENFFSILKTECIHRVKIATFKDARELIDNYTYFYNNQRIQTKTKLTPLEMRCQFVA